MSFERIHPEYNEWHRFKEGELHVLGEEEIKFHGEKSRLWYGKIAKGISPVHFAIEGIPTPPSYFISLDDLRKFELMSVSPFNRLYHELNGKTEVRKTISGGLEVKRTDDFLPSIEGKALFSRDEYNEIKKYF